MLTTEIVTKNRTYFAELEVLAKEAFPPEEYLSPSTLLEMSQGENFDFIALLDNENFVGFMVVQTHNRMAYLFFLAIASQFRGNGYGGKAIALLKDLYPDKTQVVDFEMPDPTAQNNAQRLKRRQFYLRNGYKETGLFLSYFGVDYEVMSMSDDFNDDDYKALMKSIQLENFKPIYWRK